MSLESNSSDELTSNEIVAACIHFEHWILVTANLETGNVGNLRFQSGVPSKIHCCTR